MKKSISFLTFLVLFLAACNLSSKTPQNTAPAENTKDKLQVVTTFSPLYSFTANIAGEYAEVSNLLPPNISIHDWQPKPSDVRKVSEADILITNGLKLEEFLDDLIAAADNDDLVVVDTSTGVPTFEFADLHAEANHQESEHTDQHHADEDHHEEKEGACKDAGGIWREKFAECENINAEICTDLGGEFFECASACRHNERPEVCTKQCVIVCSLEEHHEEESELDDEDHHEHHHEGTDPHIWLSLSNAQMQVQTISRALQKANPKNADQFEHNTKKYVMQLQNLEQEIQSQLAGVSKQEFITFHNAYQYFLRNFGLLEYQKAVIEELPGKTPSPEELQRITHLIAEQGVQIVFTEPQFSPKVVQTLQNEYDIQTFEIDPIGTEVSAAAYENNIRHVSAAFAKAFSSQ